MLKLSAVVVGLTAVALTSGHFMKAGHNATPFTALLPPKSLRERLKRQPPPMPGFNLNAWLGPWSFHFLKAPCSWAIAEEFTDYTQLLEPGDNLVLHHETMRSRNFCNSMTSVLSIEDPGRFYGKDLVGDNWSGKYIVVATDYRGFSIDWGCTKWSPFDQMCDDPYVFIKTRQRQLPQIVQSRIEYALQNIFGISTKELTRISHGR
ncbi:uncharacterized protein LOC132724464, partial [Ruditapes philippinarum]|uniref:uncharacterized protein LOC132724464 n=1 Tax=Ruditapes philippinarum TaxID=129788 RepID=UPI00295BC379